MFPGNKHRCFLHRPWPFFPGKSSVPQESQSEPQKSFQVNPNLRSTPLSAVKSVEQWEESSTCSLSFSTETPPRTSIRSSISSSTTLESLTPRLLICSVEEQLKPTLKFLMKLGFAGSTSLTCQNTVLLVSSVEETLVPKIEFLKCSSESEVNCMVVRSPALLTYSVEKNLKPKVEYFLNEMNGNVSELKRFPPYFKFGLEGSIKPRHKVLVENGVKPPLHLILKGDDGGFYETLINTRLRKLDGSMLSHQMVVDGEWVGMASSDIIFEKMLKVQRKLDISLLLVSPTSLSLTSLILSAHLFGFLLLLTSPLLTSRVRTPRFLPHPRLSPCHCAVRLLCLCRRLAAKIVFLLASPFILATDEELRMGLAYNAKKNIVYVADIENHALRYVIGPE
ncbi:hypothetical protein HN51_007908 [Arachis hypogaea]